MFTFESLREMTPAAVENTYLETPARGLMPRYVTQRIIDTMIGWQNLTRGVANKYLKESVKNKLAEFLRVEVDELALTSSTSHGFNLLANAIKWNTTDNVVVTDCEHPNNFYPWLHLRRLGVEVRVVPSNNGLIDPATISEYVDDNTKFVAASLVTFYPGSYLEIEKLAEITKEKGTYLVIDAIQAVGFCPLYPKEMGIDVLASAAYKGLMSPFGSGFMYTCADFLKELEPAELNMSNVISEDYSGVAYEYISSASKLQTMPNHLAGLAAMDAALDILLDLGIENVNKHITGLARSLVHNLNDIGVKTELAVDSPYLSHIVCATRPDSDEMVKYARERKLFFSSRRGGIRFGFHAYNTINDVLRATEIVEEYLHKI